jgi:hypothetical protein
MLRDHMPTLATGAPPGTAQGDRRGSPASRCARARERADNEGGQGGGAPSKFLEKSRKTAGQLRVRETKFALRHFRACERGALEVMEWQRNLP